METIVSRKILSSDLIYSVYKRREKNHKFSKIGKDLGIPSYRAKQAYVTLERYITSLSQIQRRIKNFEIAREMVLNETPAEVVKPAIVTVDPYEKLQAAEDAYHAAQVEFINAMIEKSVGDVKQRNAELEAIIQKMKLGNWISALKDKHESR